MATKQKTRKPLDEDELDLDEEFEGLDDAEVTGKLPKLKGGGYRGLQVDKVAYKDGYYGRTFIIEFTLKGEHLEGKHREGQRLCHTIAGFGKKDREHLAFGNLKNFLAAAFNKDSKSKQNWGKTAKECVKNPESTIQGKLVDAEVDERDSGHDNPMIIADFSTCQDEYDAPRKPAKRARDEDEDDDRPRKPAKRARDEDEDDDRPRKPAPKRARDEDDDLDL